MYFLVPDEVSYPVSPLISTKARVPNASGIHSIYLSAIAMAIADDLVLPHLPLLRPRRMDMADAL